MKIAMVSINAGPLACLGGTDAGGQSVVVDCLSRALAIAGNEVTLFAHRDDPSLPACLTTAAGVHVDYIDAELSQTSSAPMLLAAIETFRGRLVEQWSRDCPDIVHAHSWLSGQAAVAAARPLGIPVVQTFHGLGRVKRRRTNSSDIAPLRVGAEAALVRAASRIIATSSMEVFALLEMGASPGTIKLIPCGVDLELFSPGPRLPARNGKPFRVATLSRLVPDAGVGDVIEALTYVDDVELVIGGGRCGLLQIATDSDASALEALAEQHGVERRVAFHGRVKRDEVAAFLQSADVVICAPWDDSIGTVALEAMACGVPVIVSAVGALVDAVADGMTGIHVPPRAPRQLAYAIESLKSDPSRRERFGRFGIERTSVRYGWPRIAGETFEVYRSVAASNPEIIRSRA